MIAETPPASSLAGSVTLRDVALHQFRSHLGHTRSGDALVARRLLNVELWQNPRPNVELRDDRRRTGGQTMASTVKGVSVGIARVVPENLAPPTHASMVFAAQVATDVQLDFATLDLGAIHDQAAAARKAKPRSAVNVVAPARVYLRVVISQQAARTLRDVLEAAVKNWDGVEEAKSGPIGVVRGPRAKKSGRK